MRANKYPNSLFGVLLESSAYSSSHLVLTKTSRASYYLISIAQKGYDNRLTVMQLKTPILIQT